MLSAQSTDSRWVWVAAHTCDDHDNNDDHDDKGGQQNAFSGRVGHLARPATPRDGRCSLFLTMRCFNDALFPNS